MIYVLFNHCDWDANKKYWFKLKILKWLKKVVPSYICLISVFIRFFLLPTVPSSKNGTRGLGKRTMATFYKSLWHQCCSKASVCFQIWASKHHFSSRHWRLYSDFRWLFWQCWMATRIWKKHPNWGGTFGLFWVDSPPPFTTRLSILLQVFPHVLLHVQDQLQKNGNPFQQTWLSLCCGTYFRRCKTAISCSFHHPLQTKTTQE